MLTFFGVCFNNNIFKYTQKINNIHDIAIDETTVFRNCIAFINLKESLLPYYGIQKRNEDIKACSHQIVRFYFIAASKS